MGFNLKDHTDELLFIPLGGTREIGMNLNLYGYGDEWIMVDLGIGFANEYLPGVDIVLPDISFLEELKGKLKAIILTHAHEDHFGAVPYYFDELDLPIYATPFTSALLKRKLAEEGMRGRVDIREIDAASTHELGPFKIECVPLTHSIPEMQALAIHTPKGVVFHTGDWKFDPEPLVGPASYESRLKELGEQGVLAAVCDSTNVFVDGISGSEAGVRELLTKQIQEATGRVIVTTFASNVARVESIIMAAQAAGRSVALAGRSLWRVTEAAKEAGYLQDALPFLNDKQAMEQKRENSLIICTGCQGESRAALTRAAQGNHPGMRLVPGDTVLYSARCIPGNESSVGYVQNKLAEMDINVVTDSDADIHVSGHPARDELTKLYELIKPQIAVPVHGEQRHLKEHRALARSLGVPETIGATNGAVIKLCAEDAGVIGTVESGYMAVDGISLIPTDAQVIRTRRRLRDDGCVIVALAVDEEWSLADKPNIVAPGVLDRDEDADLFEAMSEAIVDGVEAISRNHSRQTIEEAVRKAVRRMCNNELGKKPIIELQLLRV